jgi:hypothetical protein
MRHLAIVRQFNERRVVGRNPYFAFRDRGLITFFGPRY